MISCIIVDDEPLAHDVLESHINRYGKVKLVGKCTNALAAFDLIHRQKVDLIFLDIKMPGIDGISFIKLLKDPPKIIFTTAYSDHALTAFELDAVDYLLKPVTYELFERSISKLLRVQVSDTVTPKNYTYFKVSGTLVKIIHEDLLYVQAVKDYVLLQTKSGRFLTHMTMKHLAELLPSHTFVRVHRSHVVNIHAITSLSKSHVKLGSEIIPVGELYSSNLNMIKKG